MKNSTTIAKQIIEKYQTPMDAQQKEKLIQEIAEALDNAFDEGQESLMHLCYQRE